MFILKMRITESAVTPTYLGFRLSKLDTVTALTKRILFASVVVVVVVVVVGGCSRTVRNNPSARQM